MYKPLFFNKHHYTVNFHIFPVHCLSQCIELVNVNEKEKLFLFTQISLMRDTMQEKGHKNHCGRGFTL